MTALCFVDTETTSLDPHTKAVWEVAFIRRNDDGTERRKEFQVELTNREIALADPVSLKVGDYYGRYDPLEAFSKRTAAAFIRDFTDDAVIFGLCPDFDALGLQSILNDAGKWDHHLIDVGVFGQGVFLAKNPDFVLGWPQNHKAMAEYLGVSNLLEHTAMGDAQYTADLYDAIVAYA